MWWWTSKGREGRGIEGRASETVLWGEARSAPGQCSCSVLCFPSIDSCRRFSTPSGGAQLPLQLPPIQTKDEAERGEDSQGTHLEWGWLLRVLSGSSSERAVTSPAAREW